MPFLHATGTKTDYAQARTAILFPVNKQERVDQLISLKSNKSGKVVQSRGKDKQHRREKENSLNSRCLFGAHLFVCLKR